MAELVHAPIDTAALLAAGEWPGCGAANLFLGTTRDHHEGRVVTRLEYEAHERMAIAAMEAIEHEARERFGLAQCVIVHRLGEVPVGEASVAVLTRSAHRGPAFESGRWAMDELKRRVPIWKLERYADGGSGWVAGTPLA